MNEEKSTCVGPRQTVEGQEKDTHHQRAEGQSGEDGKGKAIKVAEGMTFGAWRVLSLGEPSISMRGNKTIRWMCKCNCRWATSKEQANNRRQHRMIEHHGENKNLAQWAATYGLTTQVLFNRLARGWSIERALSPSTRPKLQLQPTAP